MGGAVPTSHFYFQTSRKQQRWALVVFGWFLKYFSMVTMGGWRYPSDPKPCVAQFICIRSEEQLDKSKQKICQSFRQVKLGKQLTLPGQDVPWRVRVCVWILKPILSLQNVPHVWMLWRPTKVSEVAQVVGVRCVLAASPKQCLSPAASGWFEMLILPFERGSWEVFTVSISAVRLASM